jgi:hypothetical protein
MCLIHANLLFLLGGGLMKNCHTTYTFSHRSTPYTFIGQVIKLAIGLGLSAIGGWIDPVAAQLVTPSNERQSMPSQRPTESLLLPLAPPLLTYQRVGGRCMYGACLTEIVIYRDRTFLLVDGTGFKQAGRLQRRVLPALTQAIQTADFNAIRAKKFTGTCPTAFDGQESIYKFYPQSQMGVDAPIELIASCTVQINSTDPVFAQTDRIVQQILALRP